LKATPAVVPPKIFHLKRYSQETFTNKVNESVEIKTTNKASWVRKTKTPANQSFRNDFSSESLIQNQNSSRSTELGINSRNSNPD
jgi:hypothetical protein